MMLEIKFETWEAFDKAIPALADFIIQSNPAPAREEVYVDEPCS